MTWVIIANRTGARIVDRGGPSLVLLESVSNELRAISGSALGTRVESPEMSASRFAHELAVRLERGRSAGEFARVILVGEARFIKQLCAALDSATLHSVLVTLSRDLAAVPLHRLAEHLP